MGVLEVGLYLSESGQKRPVFKWFWKKMATFTIGKPDILVRFWNAIRKSDHFGVEPSFVQNATI